MTRKKIQRPPFPEVIDNSMRSAFVACPKKFYWNYLLDLHSKNDLDLFFGACFAKGIEVTRLAYWRDHKTPKQSIALGGMAASKMWGDYPSNLNRNKNLVSLMDAILSYFIEFPLDGDRITPLMGPNGPLIERSFAVPIPKTKHPMTGNPIVYAGKLDMIGRFQDANFIVDEKTSKSLGEAWANNWRLRAQFTGYKWGISHFGVEVQGAIIRGIGILKRNITFLEVHEMREEFEVSAWLHQLQRDIARMVKCWRNGYWDINLDQSCAAYGGCSFITLCKSKFPERWFGEYDVRKWNPLDRREA